MDKKEAYSIVKNYVDYLKKNHFNIEKVYIFGSYMRGAFKEDSDIDLAVVFKEFPDSFDMQVQLLKLRRKFDTRIEPHPFRSSDFISANPLVNEILNNGLEII
jgi:predicted nucleotidyltransferase